MTASPGELRKRERSAKLTLWLAARASRYKSMLDRVCRKMIDRATRIDPASDFMRDPLVDNDEGFDPDELERYQRGE